MVGAIEGVHRALHTMPVRIRRAVHHLAIVLLAHIPTKLTAGDGEFLDVTSLLALYDSPL